MKGGVKEENLGGAGVGGMLGQLGYVAMKFKTFFVILKKLKSIVYKENTTNFCAN